MFIPGPLNGSSNDKIDKFVHAIVEILGTLSVAVALLILGYCFKIFILERFW